MRVKNGYGIRIGNNINIDKGTEVIMRKTKIVCTLGPSTDNEEVLRQMMLAGAIFPTVFTKTIREGWMW